MNETNLCIIVDAGDPSVEIEFEGMDGTRGPYDLFWVHCSENWQHKIISALKQIANSVSAKGKGSRLRKAEFLRCITVAIAFIPEFNPFDHETSALYFRSADPNSSEFSCEIIIKIHQEEVRNFL